MKIARKSPFTGIVHEMEIDVTDVQLAALASGALVQKVLGHLTADEREFLVSGITPAEWEAFLGTGEDE